MQTAMSSPRQTDHAVDPLFIERTSPRSFTGEPIPDETLFSMFEAARWAPSSSNVQPWRFLYAKRDTPEWAALFETLMPFNQRWCDKASALVVFASDLHMMRGADRIVSPWHAFDTGAAWMSFALQAHKLGWATHGMGGFFNDKVRANLHVPDDFDINAVIAVGKQGPADALPDDLKAREEPTPRRPLAESLFHGSWK
jgi:nitroreductase